MRKNLDIVVVGELNVDLILTGLPSLPEMGSCKIAKDMNFTLGSASAIFASNSSKLGLDIGFVGKIGDDELGEFILKNLRRSNIDISQIVKDKNEKTGICVSLSFPENYAMASYAGVRETLTLSDVDFNYLSKARHLHMSSYYLQTGIQKECVELFRKAKEMGLTTSLDPDSDPSGRWDESIFEVLKYVDIFLPNENEARRISGCDTVEEALNRLNRTVNTVVIKTGKDGVWIKTNDKIIHAGVFEVNVVDTTCAGDSFNSGFIYQYYKGSDIEKCVLWGSACAALSTTGSGGIAAFPNPLQLEQFLTDRKSEVDHLIDRTA